MSVANLQIAESVSMSCLTHFASAKHAYKLTPMAAGVIALRRVCGHVIAQFTRMTMLDPFASPAAVEIERERALDWDYELWDGTPGVLQCCNGTWEALHGTDLARVEIGTDMAPIEALLRLSRAIVKKLENS